MLDMQRNTGESPSLSEGAGAAQQGGEITLNGIVKRSNGKSTVWVNQVVQRESDPAPGLKALPRHARLPSVPVFVPGLGKTVHLKVGQTLDSDSGEIRENYQPASGNVPPSPAPQAALPPA
ncbi:MAG: hypothetical protein KGZ83_05790 [Sulfuricella sp.]|nr:hypothetical protein [Sulfuricella sp.]